jgi:hypothetical protein
MNFTYFARWKTEAGWQESPHKSSAAEVMEYMEQNHPNNNSWEMVER